MCRFLPKRSNKEETNKMSRTSFAVISIASLLIPSATEAACERYIRAATHYDGERVAVAFQDLVTCSEDEAAANFDRFMEQAGASGSEALTALAMAAINQQIWNPVWEMIGKISDYSARDDIAAMIGEKCSENEHIFPFLQGAYYGLRSREFSQWDDALETCQSEQFNAWMMSVVETPPSTTYDEKWATVARAYIAQHGESALGPLTTAAIAASANGGPFEAILGYMNDTVAPSFGGNMTEEQTETLQAALSSVASQVSPEHGRLVANRLADSGATSAAAALLPAIYPDLVQSNGGFTYAGASIEAGTCGDEQKAVIHFFAVEDSGANYAVAGLFDEPARAFRERIGRRCEAETPWPIWSSATPISNEGELEAAIAPLIAEWEGRGFEVRTREEDSITTH
jgi:hypothetical protein